MKNIKKREYNSLDGSFLKNHVVSKKHKVNVLVYENQLPINWHEVKIILDATVVEKYLKNRESSSTISPSHRERILVQKMPRLNQNVFSKNRNIMVKLEIPEDIRVNDNLLPKDSLVFDDVLVKREDCIPVLDSLDNNHSFNDGELIESAHRDYQCQSNDSFTAEAALKDEIIESESCHQETIIGQEFKDALKNEELFIGEEFKHDESIPSYENLELIDHENNDEIIKKKTRSSRKRKKSQHCDDCDHGLEKKRRVPSNKKVVRRKPPVENPKTCPKNKSQTPSKPFPMTIMHRLVSSIPKPSIGEYHCAHCDNKGRRQVLIRHLRNRHPHVFPNEPVRCSNCDMKFNSWEELQAHQSHCLLFLICELCLIDVPNKRAMVRHMKSIHPEKIHVKESGKSFHEICAERTLELTTFDQSYEEIINFYSEMKSELIKFYCPECVMTCNNIMSRTPSRCDDCKSILLYQCQKCEAIRMSYSHIWIHLTSENSGCSIYKSFYAEDKSSNSTNQASTASRNEPKRQDNGISKNGHFTCLACGISFRVGSAGVKLHKALCGIGDRFPCRFCPTTCSDATNLSDHIAIAHHDELNGRDIDEFLKEALDFRRAIKGINLKKYTENLKKFWMSTRRDYYHNGIESMLKPVCIECKEAGLPNREYCVKCQGRLNFVCLKCDELFLEYRVAWNHATRMCEKRSFTLGLRATHSANFDHCSLKNARKSILCNLIEREHHKTLNIQSRLVCHKKQVFHCGFCDKSSSYFHIIEKHIARMHINQFPCKDTSEEISDQVIEHKGARTIIDIRHRFNKYGRRIRRKFSENLQLSFYCPKCDETVRKNFRYLTETSKCPKCKCKWHVRCKICNKSCSTWTSMRQHLRNKECEAVKIDLDHSYSLKQPISEVTKNSVVKIGDVG